MKLQLYTHEDLYELAKAIVRNSTDVDYPFSPRTLHRSFMQVASLFGASASVQTVRLINSTALEGLTGTLLDRRGLEANTPRAASAPARAQGRMIPLTLPASADYTAPAGTTVIRPATATQSEISFTLEAAATIPTGANFSNTVSIVCTQNGTVGNDIPSGTDLDLKYPIAGIDDFNLTSDSGGGVARQTAPEYRTSIRDAARALGEGSWAGIEALAKTVKLDSGSRVTVSRVVEDFVGNLTYLIIDDGSGDSTLVGPTDTTTYDYAGFVINAAGTLFWEYTATGNEVNVQLPAYHLPIWTTGVDADINHFTGGAWTTLTHNTDYFVNLDTGLVNFAVPLTAGDVIHAWFGFYTGLVGLAAEYVNGVRGASDRQGWRGTGQWVRIRGPETVTQPAVSATMQFDDGFDSQFGRELAATLVLAYLDGLNIGEPARYGVVNGILSRVPGVAYIENLLLAGSCSW
jgi:hypothetical protein